VPASAVTTSKWHVTALVLGMLIANCAPLKFLATYHIATPLSTAARPEFISVAVVPSMVGAPPSLSVDPSTTTERIQTVAAEPGVWLMLIGLPTCSFHCSLLTKVCAI